MNTVINRTTFEDLTMSKNQFVTRQEYRAHCRRENATFIQQMGRGVKVEYIRALPTLGIRGRGAPEACMVAFLDANDDLVYGFSFKHPTLERGYDKPLGLRKAINRALGDTRQSEIPNRYRGRINQFLQDAETRLRSQRMLAHAV